MGNKIIEEEYEPTSQQIDTLKKQRENKINVNLFSPLNLDYYIKDQEQLALNALKFKKPKNRVENTYQPPDEPKTELEDIKDLANFFDNTKIDEDYENLVEESILLEKEKNRAKYLSKAEKTKARQQEEEKMTIKEVNFVNSQEKYDINLSKYKNEAY